MLRPRLEDSDHRLCVMAVRMHRLVAVCLPTPAYSFVVRQQVDEPAASRLAALLSLLLSSPFIGLWVGT